MVTRRKLLAGVAAGVLMHKQRQGPFRLRKAIFRGQGLTAEARAAGWDRLREMAYEGRGA